MLAFTVFGPPVPKARARVVNGHSYTPAKTRAYEKHVATLARAALSQLSRWDADGPHSLTVRVYRAARRGDLDNFVKCCSDAINGIVWVDDRNVREIHASMFEDKARPRVEIEVRCLDEEKCAEWDRILP